MFRAIHKSQQDGSRAYFIKVFTQSFRVLAIRRVLLVLLIPLGCLVLIGASYASTTNNSNQQKEVSLSKQAASDNHNENSESYFKPDQQHPVYVVNETPEKSFWIGLIDDPDNLVLSVLTGLLVICAGIQGWLLFKQDKKLELSLQNASEANKEAKQALQHAEKANKIAQDANLETKLASQRSLRAYINIEINTYAKAEAGIKYEFGFKAPGAKGIKGNYVFFLVNRGKTPAYKVRQCTTISIIETHIDQNLNLSKALEKIKIDQASIFLNPSQDYKVSKDFFLPLQSDRLSNNENLLVVGKVTYEDIYEEEHCLEFAFTLHEKFLFGFSGAVLYPIGNSSN